MVKTINLRKLVPALLLPFFVSILSGFFTRNSTDIYLNIKRPPLSPPSILFSFVWTALYLCLGFASYFMEESKCDKKRPRQAYLTLLALNLLWPIIFFRFNLFTVSAIVIIMILIASILTFYFFYRCDEMAGYLIIPLVLWVAFATYLNIGVAALN